MDEISGRLTRCPDCGGELSTRAESCPHCGAPASKRVFPIMTVPDWGYEWKSSTDVFGIPLVHVAVGRKNGRLLVAKGVIAIGQFAVGLVTVAQFGVGFLFGFGQFIFGAIAIAQFAGGLGFGLGQFASGYVAIGQFVIGVYGLGQAGLAEYLWTRYRHDPQAMQFFRNLLEILKKYLGF
jgi:hypothetical protein